MTAVYNQFMIRGLKPHLSPTTLRRVHRVALAFLTFLSTFFLQDNLLSSITPRYLTSVTSDRGLPYILGALKLSSFLLLVKRIISVFFGLTDKPVSSHHFSIILQATCILSQTTLRNFPVTRTRPSSA